ncbi:unnamed protein product [Fraxinus pennsylvanica]|uniref:Uncharacterized protein n=1 Tax=Fraxinus pennsylvanica TaxID=56036 RepID=A0AAD1ZEK2_9LAMI|nr:unnamed protein product [Fraxinus pennsylvanica]
MPAFWVLHSNTTSTSQNLTPPPLRPRNRPNPFSENRKYAKYKDMNCNEIYETYGKLFGDTGDSTKYALSPSKLSQRGFDLDTDSDRDDRIDKFPSNAEGTDSSDGPVEVGGSSSMNISGKHSGDKRKFKRGNEFGKKKKWYQRGFSFAGAIGDRWK